MLFVALFAITSQANATSQEMVNFEEVREIIGTNANFTPHLPTPEEVSELMGSEAYNPITHTDNPLLQTKAMSSKLILASYLMGALSDESVDQKAVFRRLGFVNGNEEKSTTHLPYAEIKSYLDGLAEKVKDYGSFWDRVVAGEDIIDDIKTMLMDGERFSIIGLKMRAKEEKLDREADLTVILPTV